MKRHQYCHDLCITDRIPLIYLGEEITIKQLNVNVLWYINEVEISPAVSIEEILTNIKGWFRHEILTSDEIIGYRSKDEYNFSPVGRIINYAYYKDLKRKNYMLGSLNPRGKESTNNCIIFQTIEPCIDNRELSEHITEHLYEDRANGDLFAEISDLIPEDHYLAISKLHFKLSDSSFSIETNSPSAIRWFRIMLDVCEEWFQPTSDPVQHIRLMNSTSQVGGSLITDRSLEEYLANPTQPNIDTLHSIFWERNQAMLSKICDRDMYMSIEPKARIKYKQTTRARVYVKIETLSGRSSTVQFTSYGSMIILDMRSYDELHHAWILCIKTLIEMVISDEASSTDTENSEEQESEGENSFDDYDELQMV